MVCDTRIVVFSEVDSTFFFLDFLNGCDAGCWDWWGMGACKTKKLTLPLAVMYIAYKAEK